jgi:hypothetical protein
MAAPTLVRVRQGVNLTPAAGASFVRAQNDLGREIDVNSSYRDWNTQARWHQESLDYNAGRIKFPGHAYAVAPEFSDHCKGLAIDTDDWNKPGFLAFMAARGWIQTDKSKGEEHHLAYRIDRDQHRNRPAGTGSVLLPASNASTPPAPIQKKEEDMPIRVTNGVDYYLVGSNDLIHLSGPENDGWDGLTPVYTKNQDQLRAIQASIQRSGSLGQLSVVQSSIQNTYNKVVESESQIRADLNYISNVQPHSLLAIFNKVNADQPDIELTETQLNTLGAKVGAAVKIDVVSLVNAIDKANDDEQAALLAAISIAPQKFLDALAARIKPTI